jgi:hypothetical protein
MLKEKPSRQRLQPMDNAKKLILCSYGNGLAAEPN